MEPIKKYLVFILCLLSINNLACFSLSINKVVYQNEDIEVTQKQIHTKDKFFEQNFKLYKIQFKNKGNKKQNLEGIIFNQVTSKEAEAKFKQIEYEQKEKRKKIAIAGAVAFVGTTAFSAIFSPGLVFWGIIQKAASTPLLGKADSYFVEKKNSDFLGKVSPNVSQEVFYEFTLEEKAIKEIYYLLPSSEKLEGVFVFRVKKYSGDNNYKVFSHKLNPITAKELFDTPSKKFFQSAFINTKLLKDQPSGIYLSKQDKLTPIMQSNQSLQEKPIKINLKKSQIFVYQNIFRMPKRYQLTLHRIKNSQKPQSSFIESNFVKFALKEIEPGIMQLQTPRKDRLILSAGNYALVHKTNDNRTKVYDFYVYGS